MRTKKKREKVVAEITATYLIKLMQEEGKLLTSNRLGPREKMSSIAGS